MTTQVLKGFYQPNGKKRSNFISINLLAEQTKKFCLTTLKARALLFFI